MSLPSLLRTPFTALLLACLAPSAHAGAFFFPERGARALSFGGAFIAGADDLNAQWLNPAALTRLSRDLSLYVDFALIFADQRFARAPDAEVVRKDPRYADGFPTVRDEGPPFPDPSLGFASNFGLEDWVFAFGVYGPYAGTNQWPDDGPQRYALTSLSATELFFQLSAAWRPIPELSVGIGLQSVLTAVKQRLVISSYPGVFGWSEQRDLDVLAEVDVVDAVTPSANLGVLATPLPGFDIGVSVQLPVAARPSGKLRVRLPDHYYFSETSVEGDAIGLTLDFPWMFRLGLRAYDEGLWSVELASVVELWSALDRIAVRPGRGGIAFEGVPGIGSYSVKPFDMEYNYRDVVSVRLGGSFAPGRGPVTLRAGVFFETAAAPDATLSVMNIDGAKIGGALGGSVRLGLFEIDLSAAWVERFERNVTTSTVTQVNPIYAEDPKPYSDDGPSIVGNGTYQARHFVIATTLSAGF